MRHIEKLLFEFADQYIGALNQRSHFVKQRIVFNRFATATDLSRGRSQLARDLGFAFGKAGDDRAILRHGCGVTVCILEHYWRYLGFEPVALGAVAGLQTKLLYVQHFAAMQCDKPVHRTNKAHAAPTRQFAAIR